MKKENIEFIRNFLKDYEKICQKYKMGLSGCGCCGSPFIISYQENIDYSINDIRYNKKLNKILVEDYDLYSKLPFKINDNDKTIDKWYEILLNLNGGKQQ